MPQPLKDIEERIDLLKMTLGMFAPSEPAPVAAELLQLGEEILEHAVIVRGHTPLDKPSEGSRLLALQAQCTRLDPALVSLDDPCRRLLDRYDAVMAETDEAQIGPLLLAAAEATGDLYSVVAAD